MITKRDDDYLICGEYEKHINSVSSEYPGFITFQHANGNHYFAWVDSKGLILRSEAYPDAEKMERGIKAIQKNRDLAERYSVDTAHGVHFLVLWGGGDHTQHTGNMGQHNEIGRSCPKKTRKEIHDLLLSKGVDFADKVVPLSDDERGSAAEVAVATAATAASSFASSSSSSSSTSSSTTSHSTSSGGGSSYSDGDNDGGGMGWLKWLLPLLLLLGGLWWAQKSCKKSEASVDAAPVVDTVKLVAPVAPAEVFAKETGVTLSGAAAEGIENSLIGFIKDSARLVNDSLWFDFDRLLFDSGKATLQPASQEQLTNVAAILKAFPKVKIRIGGYTDSQGDDNKNLKLSNDRANNVMAELVKLGIDKVRMTAKGYGEKHPVASNDTEEGRQQNRRISIRVDEK